MLSALPCKRCVMSEVLKIKVEVNDDAISQKLKSLTDDDVMLQIHNLLAKMCDPYVPMDEGVLAQTIEIIPRHVRYNVPYAHYMYTGVVYGPNIPITDNGMITGWFSPPGQKKYNTGRPISYSPEKHPLATKEWDKAMMRDKKDEFIAQVTEILKRKAEKLND